MRLSAFALSFTVLGAVGIVGCSSSDSGTATQPPPPTSDMTAGGGTAGGMNPGGGPAPALTAGGKGSAGGSKVTSFDSAPESMKKLWGGSGGGEMPAMGGMAGGGGATAGAKPSPIRSGMIALASRKDPFESLFKQVVQITPAWNYVVSHRTEAPFVPKTELEGPKGVDDLPPLPPIPRRVAGVFYNGGITAIIESGNPPDSTIAIVQPGVEVPSGVPGQPDLIVESISMESLILRARDGRSVEVKLSGLSPAVRDALRQQFTPANTGTGGGAGFPGGMGGGMGRPGAGMGRPGGGKGGDAGGGGGGA